MKYISFVVPSYNSEKYLNKCIDSLLYGGEDVEIIIVNDGSIDRTLEIALEYQNKYPTIVKVVDQENGGHGSGLNAGIKNATGLYFKCVDSDDWVEQDSYKKVLDVLKSNHELNNDPDLYLTNYVFERLDCNKQYIHKNTKAFAPNKMLSWADVKKLGLSEYIVMHSMIYKLDVLKESKVNLPLHTYYVDNIFTFVPLKYVKTLYYLDIDFYRYYVGRPGQSISTKNMTDRYQMQLTVMKEIVKSYTYEDLKKLNKHHLKIMIHDLVIKHFLTCFFIYGNYSKEKNNEFHQYFRYFKNVSLSLYRKIMYRSCFTFGRYIFLPIKIFATKLIYKKIVRKRNWY